MSDQEALSIAQQRLIEFIEKKAAQGISQNEIARRSGVPAQYLSDIKAGRRSVTELFARRIEEEFGVDDDWLQGRDSATDPVRSLKMATGPKQNRVRVAIFPHPIAGEPYSQPTWDGSELEICGAAVARIISAELPYALRFGAQDRKGRLRKDDLILVSQAVSHRAEIQILKGADKMFLARRTGANKWEAVAPKKLISGETTIAGHCVGILWGSLNA